MSAEQMNSMLIVSEHTVMVTPEVLSAIAFYAHYFSQDMQRKLQEYLAELGGSDSQVDISTELVADVQREISRAEAIRLDMVLLEEEMQHIYRWHFERLAEVFRKTRVQLEAEDIENIHVAKLVLTHLMEMLQQENSKFNRKKFINYINK